MARLLLAWCTMLENYSRLGCYLSMRRDAQPFVLHVVYTLVLVIVLQEHLFLGRRESVFFRDYAFSVSDPARQCMC